MSTADWKPFSRVANPESLPRHPFWSDVHGEDTHEVYVNPLYIVFVRRYESEEEGESGIIHLSIKRHDQSAIRDWRDMQRIKNEIVGPEHEAIELYPAESRLVDTSNHYHLWVFTDPEFRVSLGFRERLLVECAVGGSQQRLWRKGERPADALTNPDDVRRMIEDLAKGDQP